ncbi:Hypothetical predicted protein [Olea europaea subsp. europaea]|uniref:Uncharacterized protein n=2 Tax=Olea europaea subsp. europaea TaxID=158383 RepID=A0A8S0TB47_OLEEU|nr:Hypothetical predicted protein [Olea europaea subsp. europaea]
MVKTCIKNLKRSEQRSTNEDKNPKVIATLLKESYVNGFSVLKSALTLFRSKQKTWSLSCHVHSQTEEESNSQEFYVLNTNKLRKEMDTLSVKDVMKQSNASENVHPGT